MAQVRGIRAKGSLNVSIVCHLKQRALDNTNISVQRASKESAFTALEDELN